MMPLLFLLRVVFWTIHAVQFGLGARQLEASIFNRQQQLSAIYYYTKVPRTERLTDFVAFCISWWIIRLCLQLLFVDTVKCVSKSWSSGSHKSTVRCFFNQRFWKIHTWGGIIMFFFLQIESAGRLDCGWSTNDDQKLLQNLRRSTNLQKSGS